jgi:arginine-tRNA-protein transferase
MKLLFKENENINYNQYEFPYCVYAVSEKGDTYHDLYTQGFLPYSNDLNIQDEIFYLARSVRIDLQAHEWKFKQNNVFNKLRNLYPEETLRFELKEKAALIDDKEFQAWCLQNAKNRFLSAERLHYILSRPYLKQVLVISSGEKVLACLFVISEHKAFVHVWFSFYDLQYSGHDFGKWIILNSIAWAKKQEFSWFYIGTCYSKNALYKLTLSCKTQYFSSSGWNENISDLKKKLLEEK